MLVAVLLLYSEARRDLDAVLTLLAVFALLTAICIGIYLFSVENAGTMWQVATGVAALVAVFLGYLRMGGWSSSISGPPGAVRATRRSPRFRISTSWGRSPAF